MTFQDIVQAAQVKFPNLKIAYKNQSTLMKVLGTIMFFNKGFMTDFITTIGSTVYFPSEDFVKQDGYGSVVTLMHELVHVSDAKKYSSFLFGLGYCFPQILSILSLFLFFVSWKIALPLVVLFALPLPAYFRMYFERRGYFVSAYANYKLYKKLNMSSIDSDMSSDKAFFAQQFTGSDYYFMWPFSSIKNDFDLAATKIMAGQRPIEDPIFDLVDELLNKV